MTSRQSVIRSLLVTDRLPLLPHHSHEKPVYSTHDAPATPTVTLSGVHSHQVPDLVQASPDRRATETERPSSEFSRTTARFYHNVRRPAASQPVTHLPFANPLVPDRSVVDDSDQQVPAELDQQALLGEVPLQDAVSRHSAPLDPATAGQYPGMVLTSNAKHHTTSLPTAEVPTAEVPTANLAASILPATSAAAGASQKEPGRNRGESGTGREPQASRLTGARGIVPVEASGSSAEGPATEARRVTEEEEVGVVRTSEVSTQMKLTCDALTHSCSTDTCSLDRRCALDGPAWFPSLPTANECCCLVKDLVEATNLICLEIPRPSLTAEGFLVTESANRHHHRGGGMGGVVDGTAVDQIMSHSTAMEHTDPKSRMGHTTVTHGGSNYLSGSEVSEWQASGGMLGLSAGSEGDPIRSVLESAEGGRESTDGPGLVATGAGMLERGRAEASLTCSFLCCPRPGRFCGPQCCMDEEYCGESISTGLPCCSSVEPRVHDCCLVGTGWFCDRSERCCLDETGCVEVCESGGGPVVLGASALLLSAAVGFGYWSYKRCRKDPVGNLVLGPYDATQHELRRPIYENGDSPASPETPPKNRPTREESKNMTSGGVYGHSITISE
ncbi:hypothetical protein GNI_035540 [Gregarina niphandrodes]|uniref:Uncharacterized protein n=1 Tax=Gregarina niphandrodes TaxID=110365 RepID=A0A023BAR0_GRENI|nr:hypothetical protein GNI_035540 [Gregarina niphandrodes]EZG78498.1 hypothetical protein GNI_035540 [Gregarina niphandrodes]|eukprot:XP_011129282.1 hypothetical protein GNI_035540 [Gregarina niphandrodes]